MKSRPMPYVLKRMMTTPLQKFLLRWGMGDGADSGAGPGSDGASSACPEASSTSGRVRGRDAGQRKAPASLSADKHAIKNAALIVAASLAMVLGVGCGPETPHSGVISTENAGRVSGKLQRSDSLFVDSTAEIRLYRIASDGRQILVERVSANADGSYSFASLKPGTYRVDADLPNGQQGTSGAFDVAQGGSVQLVLVLVAASSYQVALVPPAGDQILSVWVGDSTRPVSCDASTCRIPVVPGVEDQVGVVVQRASGAVETVLYKLAWTSSVAKLVLLAGTSAPSVQAGALHHFAVDSATVALWTFDSLEGSVVRDIAHGRNLTASSGVVLEASPLGKAAVLGAGTLQAPFDSALSAKPTGELLYEARVWMDKYPSSSLWNARSTLLGFYEGIKILVSDTGSIQIGGQQGVNGVWNWFPPESDKNTMPLGRWVDIAVSVRRGSGEAWLWLDGVPVALHTYIDPMGPWRDSYSTFVVGNDSVDDQPFSGKVDEIRVSNRIPALWSKAILTVRM